MISFRNSKVLLNNSHFLLDAISVCSAEISKSVVNLKLQHTLLTAMDTYYCNGSSAIGSEYNYFLVKISKMLPTKILATNFIQINHNPKIIFY